MLLRIYCCALVAVASLFGAVGQSTDQFAHNLLVNGLHDRDPNRRKEAALALGLMGPREEASHLLLPLLSDQDVQVRIAAIGSLVDLHDSGAVPELKKSLQDPVPEVEFAAAKALWTFKNELGTEALLAILEGRRQARSNFMRREFREIRRSFSTPKGSLELALNYGIGFVPFPGIGAGYAALEDLIWQKGFSPRASVALLLAKDKNPATSRALVDALSDGDWSVRAAAAQAIGLRNEPEMRRHLVPLLSDRNSRVRYRAAAAYLRLGEIASRTRS
jgi:HEAT repeat protein